MKLAALLVVALVGAPRAAAAQAGAAQVGHDPERSPFTDLTTHQGVTWFAGRFSGYGGAPHTGPRPGLAIGMRLQMRLATAIDLWATLGEVSSSRARIDAAAGTNGDSARVMPDTKLRLLLADLALVLNITGDKMWHRLAPYAAMGFGYATPTTNLVDPGGFQLGGNFALVPTIGTRWFVSRSLALRFEARDYYYRYSYPLSYYTSHFNADGTPVLPLSVSDRGWSNNFTFWFGVTYGFNF